MDDRRLVHFYDSGFNERFGGRRVAAVLHRETCLWADDLLFDENGRAETDSGVWQWYASPALAGRAAGEHLVSDEFYVVLVSVSTCCG